MIGVCGAWNMIQGSQYTWQQNQKYLPEYLLNTFIIEIEKMKEVTYLGALMKRWRR